MEPEKGTTVELTKSKPGEKRPPAADSGGDNALIDSATPRGKTRSIAFSILLTIVTIGLYLLYWTYQTYGEMKRYSGNGVGGPIGLVPRLVVTPVTLFLVPHEVRGIYEDDALLSS